MAYASWSVVFGEQPSAAKWNMLGTNDASFNDGTGIANIATNTTAISNPYKFSAYRSAAYTNDAAAFKKVTFEVEDFDTNGNYDNATNYRYTVPVSGFYQFNASYGFLNSPGSFGIISLYKNGTEAVRGTQVNASAAVACNACALLSLSPGDYVEVFVYGTSAVSMDTGSGNRAKFSGFLVSRT